MFPRSKIRRKDGKEHQAWSVVENRRVHDGRVVQRQMLYLGESMCRAISRNSNIGSTADASSKT
jgi:hypothetical protein